MKFSKKSLSVVNSLVNNVYILYVIAFIALIDILGYILRKEFSAVLFFYLLGMLTFYYTKNMTIVLLSAILGTSLLHFIKNLMGYKEGMKGKKAKKNKNKNKKLDEEEDDDLSVEETEDKDKDKDDENEDEEEDEDVLENMKQSLGKGFKKKSGYQNQVKLKPGMYNIPNKEDMQRQLGEADKMEKAYDNLEKIVGEKGIKSVSNSTKDLIKQQDELLKGLKDITPAINDAMTSIGKIDFNKLTGLLG